MADNLMLALTNSDSDFEKKTLQYIISLRGQQLSTSEKQDRKSSEANFSDVLDVRSRGKIHNSHLIDYSLKKQKANNTNLLSSVPKVPANSIISYDSYDFGSKMLHSDSDEFLKNLPLSIRCDSQSSESYKPPKLNRSMEQYQHKLEGNDIPEDLAKVNNILYIRNSIVLFARILPFLK